MHSCSLDYIPAPRMPDPLLRATAVFHLENGKTVSFEDVRPDSIGPSAEATPGVIGVEFDGSDRLVHVPFVLFWEVSYR